MKTLTASQYRALPKAKTNKYRNVRTTDSDGVVHASKKQAARWAVLQQMQKAGKIADLRREVSFDIVVNGVKICRYVADHLYLEPSAEHPTIFVPVVEDVKGKITAVFRLKCKLMRAVHGIIIKEI